MPVASPAGAGLAPSSCRNGQYFILQTHANAERSARDALQASYRGCTVYLPLELVTVVHARRRKEVVRAFLPRYLFVLDEGQGGPVMRTAPGVSHVVRCGDRPAMIAQKFIDRIKARETEARSPDGRRVERYVDLDATFTPTFRDLFLHGEEVRVSDGPFASFNAIFDRWLSNEQRALVAVQIFGRSTPCELEPSQFEKL